MNMNIYESYMNRFASCWQFRISEH